MDWPTIFLYNNIIQHIDVNIDRLKAALDFTDDLVCNKTFVCAHLLSTPNYLRYYSSPLSKILCNLLWWTSKWLDVSYSCPIFPISFFRTRFCCHTAHTLHSPTDCVSGGNCHHLCVELHLPTIATPDGEQFHILKKLSRAFESNSPVNFACQSAGLKTAPARSFQLHKR